VPTPLSIYDTVAKIDSGVGTGAITDFTGITL